MSPIKDTLFFIREAALSFRRGGIMSMTSMSTIAISLTVLGAFLLLNMNLNEFAGALRSQVEITAYLETGYSQDILDQIIQQISELNGVISVEYISREKALARLQADFAEEEFLFSTLGENPLPSSLEIKMKDPALLRAAAKALRSQIVWVNDVSYGEDVVMKIEAAAEMIKTIGATLVILLGLASLFIIANTIKLTVYARRQEIEIMRLVGATNWFIRWPFILEGLFQGLLGSAIAVTVLYSSYEVVMQKTNEILPIFPFVTDPLLIAKMSFRLTLIGGLLGVVGSMFAVRKFLRL